MCTARPAPRRRASTTRNPRKSSTTGSRLAREIRAASSAAPVPCADPPDAFPDEPRGIARPPAGPDSVAHELHTCHPKHGVDQESGIGQEQQGAPDALGEGVLLIHGSLFETR